MPHLTRVARPASPALRRLASVTALLAIAVIGLRARTAIPLASRPAAAAIAGRSLVVVLGTIEGVGALACIVLLVLVFRGSRRKRRPPDELSLQPEPTTTWWSRALALLSALAVLVLPLILLALQVRGHAHGSALRPGPVSTAGPAGSPGIRSGHPAAGGAASWWRPAGLAAAGVTAVALGLLARRRPPGPADGNPPAPLAERLAVATSAGTAALSSHDDPRGAIIACYAAMERSLAGAGSPAAAADTPAEVLGRASAAGLVRSAAAEALTRLFRRARYSQHPLAEDDRAEATNALAGIRADLRDQAQPATDPENGR